MPKKSHRQKGPNSVRNSKSGKDFERKTETTSPRKKGTPPITPRTAAEKEKEKRVTNEKEGKEVLSLERKRSRKLQTEKSEKVETAEIVVTEKQSGKEETSNPSHVRKQRKLKKSKSRSKLETASHSTTPLPTRSKIESGISGTETTKSRKQAKQHKASESAKEASGEKIASPREDSASDD